jgi:hypothetical protein
MSLPPAIKTANGSPEKILARIGYLYTVDILQWRRQTAERVIRKKQTTVFDRKTRGNYSRNNS